MVVFVTVETYHLSISLKVLEANRAFLCNLYFFFFVDATSLLFQIRFALSALQLRENLLVTHFKLRNTLLVKVFRHADYWIPFLFLILLSLLGPYQLDQLFSCYFPVDGKHRVLILIVCTFNFIYAALHSARLANEHHKTE